ncbi:MAG: OmpA family protein [Bacteroidales bacterium]|jgi:chemotaxis protein MotB|nr:OmpA family protein [Bacteroidales bacterium]
MKKILIVSTAILAVCIGLEGCVSKKVYTEISDALSNCEAQRKKIEIDKTNLDNQLAQLKSTQMQDNERIKQFLQDTLVLGRQNRELQSNLNNLQQNYDELTKTYSAMNTGNKKELENMLARLNGMQQQLETKEKELNDLEEDLTKKTNDLNAQNAKMIELQSILDKKDADVQALKAKIKTALKGFEGSDLAVSEKDGKIYVSMDEKLLFASGKFNIDPKGEEALKALANVLTSDTGINVLVEGHTDNVPLTAASGAQIRDNWDLSVMRATSVVKAILKYAPSIQPQRLTAAGRGEYVPIDDNNTKEARSKNRRTEIILTPNLNALLEVLK